MNLYVSFEDLLGPTFIAAEQAWLVESSGESPSEDPIKVPIIPSTASEVITFANMMGWKVTTDSRGDIVLHTHTRGQP